MIVGAETLSSWARHLNGLHVQPVVARPLRARRECQLGFVGGDDGRQEIPALQKQALRLGDLRQAPLLPQTDREGC